jgi:hypothetical protein
MPKSRTKPAAAGVQQMTAGERLARGIAANSRPELLDILAPEVEFRASTPNRFWEANSASEVVDVFLGSWFGGDRQIDGIERIDCDTVGDCEHVGYRFRATVAGSPHLVEQQAYLLVDEGVVTSLRVLCSGFRPIGAGTEA